MSHAGAGFPSETTACSETEHAAGILFDVKRFAIRDGPGIRTTAFLKGCPLSCAWCHNPESQRSEPELLFWASRCTGCGSCVPMCPAQAIELPAGKVATTDRGLCIGCGRCVAVCPRRARAVVGEKRTAEDVVGEVDRDVLFFDQSRGGVTLSGGEPLMQPEFLIALLRACRDRRIETAVDTCGHADGAVVEAIAGRTDLFLYDIKLLDSRRHERATGVANDLILENARRLAARGSRMWIRFPLVPGVNDDEADIAAIGRFVRGLSSVEAVQVLPYHEGGEAKRERLGRAREMEGVKEPSAADVARAADVLRREARRPVSIGG